MVDVSLKSETNHFGWNVNGEMDYLNRTPRGQKTGRQYVWRPPTDVYETDKEIIIRVEISGMKNGDFSITLEDRALVIRGIRMEKPERRAYHQMEIRFGEFATQVEIPSPIISEGIKAEYNDGLLMVTLEKAKPQRIDIGK